MAKLLTSVLNHYCASYHGIPKLCWINIIFNLLNAISVGVCFFLSLYFNDQLHFNMVMVGFLMSSYGVGTMLGGIISGKLCDIYSADRLAVISLICQSISFFALAWFDAIISLIVILFILGISSYSFKTANYVSMLFRCGDDKHLRQKAINVSHAASNFGLGISGIIVGLLAEYGYANIFYCATAILVCSAIYLLFDANQKTTLYQYHAIQRIGLNADDYLANFKVLALVLLSIFFVGLIIAQLGSTYPVYVKTVFPDLATKAVSILFILDTVLIVLFQAPLSNFYMAFNTVIVMGIGAFLMGLGMIVLSLSSTFVLAMVSCCIWTTGEMLFLPSAQLLCYENSARNKKGQSIGLFQSTYAVSTVVGPTIGGIMYSHVDINAMWYMSMLIGTVCLLSCVAIVRDLKKDVPLPQNSLAA